MTKKKRWRLIACCMIAVLALVGCSSGDKSEQPLIVAQGVDATMLDPNMHSETTTANVERQIFDPLIENAADSQFEPALATRWEAISDTVWEVELRTGVQFHDGVEFTADDVKYTIERILDPSKNSPQAPNYNSIVRVEVKNDHLLHIHTEEPYPVLPARLANLRIVPKHYVEQVGDERFKREPIGTGPYKLVKWDKDEQVVLKANENYWRGEPEIKEVIFKAIPEAASRVMALQAGQVDIAVNIPPHQVEQVNKSGKAAIVAVPSTRFLLAQFMMHEGSPFADQRVRLAVNLAVDVESIIDNLLGGNATPMTQTLSDLDFGHNPNLKAYGYDPERAKELLAEAGYADGFRFTMLAPTGRYMMDKEVAEAVKSQLEAVGLQVDLKLPEWGVYVDQIMRKQIEADMWLIGWGNSLLDAEGTLYTWFHSGQRFFHYDVGQARNREVDALLDKARTSLDASVREQTYHQALALIHADVPWLLLFQQKDLYGVSNRVDWTPRSDEAIILYNAKWK
ncbi:MAG: ABC transporter substrate-binding protein [Firmicutes bacterium]|nr:ABC transporter substrate-binding protein [Bacillota bacterium]